MTAPDPLTVAARQVIASWEHGDLAAAVNRLRAILDLAPAMPARAPGFPYELTYVDGSYAVMDSRDGWIVARDGLATCIGYGAVLNDEHRRHAHLGGCGYLPTGKVEAGKVEDGAIEDTGARPYIRTSPEDPWTREDPS